MLIVSLNLRKQFSQVKDLMMIYLYLGQYFILIHDVKNVKIINTKEKKRIRKKPKRK